MLIIIHSEYRHKQNVTLLYNNLTVVNKIHNTTKFILMGLP